MPRVRVGGRNDPQKCETAAVRDACENMEFAWALRFLVPGFLKETPT